MDYRLILAPKFIWDERLASTIMDLTGSEEVTRENQLICKSFNNPKNKRCYSLTFRVIPALEKDIGLDSDQPLQDSVGRNILHVEGVIYETNINKSDTFINMSFFVEKVHINAINVYKEFWNGSFNKVFSEPLELSSLIIDEEMNDQSMLVHINSDNNNIDQNLSKSRSIFSWPVNIKSILVNGLISSRILQYFSKRLIVTSSLVLILTFLLCISYRPFLLPRIDPYFKLKMLLKNRDDANAFLEIINIATKNGDLDKSKSLSQDEIFRLKCDKLNEIYELSNQFNFNLFKYFYSTPRFDSEKTYVSSSYALTEELLKKIQMCISKKY